MLSHLTWGLGKPLPTLDRLKWQKDLRLEYPNLLSIFEKLNALNLSFFAKSRKSMLTNDWCSKLAKLSAHKSQNRTLSYYGSSCLQKQVRIRYPKRLCNINHTSLSKAIICRARTKQQPLKSKIKNAKKNSTRTLERLCAQNRSKKTKYSRDETILKIGHLAKAIAHAKPLQNGRFRLKKMKIQKTYEKQFYKNVRVIVCKKTLEKTTKIPEIRQFWKSAILQRL